MALTFQLFGASHAATPLPYKEVFGDLQTERCGIEWVGRVCEEGWRAQGEANSLRMSKLAAVRDRHVILMKPGDGMWNGISRTFETYGHPWVRVGALVAPVDGASTFYMRVIFRDERGVTRGTTTEKVRLVRTTQIVKAYSAPAGTVTAELIWAAVGGDDEDTRVAILAHVNDPCDEDCHDQDHIPGPWDDPDWIPPEGWRPPGWDGDNWPFDLPPEPGLDECPPGGDICDEECAISCDGGQVPVGSCLETECGMIGHCECVDPADAECPLESVHAYL